ncbi:binding- -dependent transport systems inner membrane protein [Babesia ovis]|uniref:Binding- -dependent transport systems inner membrane protein n=1 Tax=Babesia ovis TaxID=5869 RepID=A0A9W5T8G1_BABOV|nr:binding- -dependent transport systems inner membrane protein [Babesia ovis]
MEDWQKWTRRAANAAANKTPPKFLFFPNRTAGQTYFITVITGIAIMSLSFGLIKSAEDSQDEVSRTLQADTRIRKCDINNEHDAIFRRREEENRIRRRRQYLHINQKPAAAVLISDPDLRNNETSGHLDI